MAKIRKKLFVTGGAGFIGSAFVGQRINAGDEVIVYDSLTYAGHRENLEWIDNSEKRLKLVIGDICDTRKVIKLIKKNNVDAVINFAAESHVDNSINESAIFIETNIKGTHSLLEASREYWNGLSDKKNFRFIQISTDEVYGSLGPKGKFSETSIMQPNSPYSASKAAGDHLARAWHHTYGLPVIVTNCSNNYGPRQHPEKLIPNMITCALAGKNLPVYGDGKNIRDWIQAEDHCRGLYLALTKGKPGQTYCFGGNAERNNIETVTTICKILDDLKPRKNGRSYEDLISFVKDRPGHDRRYAINDAKARKELGFKRKYKFEDGLFATVKWYLENQQWCEKIRKKK